MKVWVTRARPGAESTAGRLAALGHTPIVAPLLEARSLATRLDLAGVVALAFTSANAVRACADLGRAGALPVFAVGAATARAARAAGFTNIVAGDGDVRDLAALIAHHAPLAGAVLHPTSPLPAGDLVGALAARGIAARAVAVYETVATPVKPPAAGGVLLHSPRAAAVLAGLLARGPAPDLRAFCLSPAVAAPLGRTVLAGVLCAPRPTEDALLGLLAFPA